MKGAIEQRLSCFDKLSMRSILGRPIKGLILSPLIPSLSRDEGCGLNRLIG
jgi:hypothetical protein